MVNWVVFGGVGVYLTSITVGWLARAGRFRHRPTHHILYAANIGVLPVVAWSRWHPALMLVAVALIALPFWRAGTRQHITAALVGAVGYLVAAVAAVAAAVATK
ncbi:MAG: hypothetical protein B7733_15270 [Myxococcales bacterium FL481]|nr:MAG: hypothetical protein B7733_15270 [Myxococcales bacterium FL481]